MSERKILSSFDVLAGAAAFTRREQRKPDSCCVHPDSYKDLLNEQRAIMHFDFTRPTERYMGMDIIMSTTVEPGSVSFI